MKHPHAWNWDRKGDRNLCYKHNQQNQVNEHPCKEMEKICGWKKSKNPANLSIILPLVL
jgi:hypothetical protein